MDSFEKVIRKKIDERKDVLSGAISATENLLAAYDKYLEMRRCVFDFDDPSNNIEEMPLKFHGEILSLRARLSLYTQGCFQNGLEANFPDFLQHEKKRLKEKIDAESENTMGGFALAILQEKLSECAELTSMIDSAFNETAFDDDSPCYVDESENVDGDGDGESQGGSNDRESESPRR